MKTLAQNPAQWRLSTLLSLHPEEVHELACWAVGSLTSFRLILGRCLLALHTSKGYKGYGCSTAVHYGTSVLGVSVRVARECKRVAGRLQNLPALSLTAERGQLPWTKLREIVRVASPETENYWLELANKYDSACLQKLVSQTPVGQLPGDADYNNTCTSEFRFAAKPAVLEMFRRARRMCSKEQDQHLSATETLEYLLANFFSTQTLDAELLEEMRLEADKDLQAERAREIPQVQEARNMAEEMGLVGDGTTDAHQQDQEVDKEAISLETLLAQAIGAKRPRGVISRQLTKAVESWKNKRLRYNPRARHTTKAQKQDLHRRDGWCCSTPGCPNQSWLHIHHIKPYAKGGSTTPDNLLSLCSGCHRNLHDGALKITPNNNGQLTFTDQQGRNLKTQANLELAAWLDFRMGWRGGQEQSHQHRVLSGDWAVFGRAG